MAALLQPLVAQIDANLAAAVAGAPVALGSPPPGHLIQVKEGKGEHRLLGRIPVFLRAFLELGRPACFAHGWQLFPRPAVLLCAVALPACSACLAAARGGRTR